MKDSTKVRLHLSKQLFESLTREIIKETKANDGYSVAVKQPKTPKQSKSQATSPEVQKTDAEAMMGEMEMNVAEKKQKMDEFVGTETEMSGVITMLATLLGVGVPLATGLVKHLKQAKTPEEKKKVLQQELPGTGGDKPSQSKDALKEYEHHYEMVNGQCRRYNDEGDYEVVSSHYCR